MSWRILGRIRLARARNCRGLAIGASYCVKTCDCSLTVLRVRLGLLLGLALHLISTDVAPVLYYISDGFVPKFPCWFRANFCFWSLGFAARAIGFLATANDKGKDNAKASGRDNDEG